MKKLIATFILITSIAFLTGCGENKNTINVNQIALSEEYDSKVDYSVKKIEDYTVNVTAENVYDMIIMKETFVLLFGSSASCGQCISMKPALIRYILETKTAFHYINVDLDSNYLTYQAKLEPLNDKNGKKIFTAGGTPVFYFFEKGSLIEEKPKARNHDSYQNLKSMLEYRLRRNAVKTLPNLNALDHFEKKNQIILFYALEDMTAKPYYQDHFVPTKLETYFFHLSLFDLPDSFILTYGLSTKTNTAAVKYEEDSTSTELVFVTLPPLENVSLINEIFQAFFTKNIGM